jgi:hypothetical protein
VAEDTAYTNLVAARALTLPAVDQSIMPARPRSKYSKPLNRSLQRRANQVNAAFQNAIAAAGGQVAGQGGNHAANQAANPTANLIVDRATIQPIIQGIIRAGNQAALPAAVVPPAAPAAPYVNTTVPFWPVQGDLMAPIPSKRNGDNWLGELTLQGGAEDCWHGVKFLGKGASV